MFLGRKKITKKLLTTQNGKIAFKFQVNLKQLVSSIKQPIFEKINNSFIIWDRVMLKKSVKTAIYIIYDK